MTPARSRCVRPPRRALLRRSFLTLAAAVVAVMQAGCAGANPITSGDAGMLVTVQRPWPDQGHGGAYVDADVVVRGVTRGGPWHLTRGRSFDDVEPGVYLVEPADVYVDGRRYIGLPGPVTVTVAAGETVTVPITYVDAERLLVFGDPPPVTVKPGSRTFHVDCEAGNDAFSGLSAARAFRSLARTVTLDLQPGDRLLLRRGCEWRGPLTIGWHGSDAWPVEVGAYGEGPLPLIHDALGNNVDIYGSRLVIEHLDAVTSPDAVPTDPLCRDQPVGWRTGFTIQHEANNVTIRYSRASGHTAGVHVTRGASHNRIVNNELVDNVIMSINTDDGGFDDSGAWGVVLNGADNAVAYNRFSGNTAWCSYDFGQEGASIEVYEGIRNLIHHNISIEDTTFSEIGGSDIRRAAENTYAMNVYVSTHENSEFLVLRGAAGHFGPTPGTRVFNNSVYLSHPGETQGIVCYSGCGPDILEVRNNAIWVEWKGLYADAPFAETNNLYWRGNGHPLLQFFGEGNAMDESSLIADPLFRDVAGFDLRPAAGSPLIGAGVAVDVAFDRDAAGVVIDEAQGVDIGAYRRP